MTADLTATNAWQSTAELTEPTLFQCKGFEVQLTDADPGGDLTQGLVLPTGIGHIYPAGKAVWYRTAQPSARIAVQSAG